MASSSPTQDLKTPPVDQQGGAVEQATTAATLEMMTNGSSVSLVEMLGLAEEGELSLQKRLLAMHIGVMSALEEVTTITTYDHNLEHQYIDVVKENTKLHGDLEKARNEIRHLRGQLSVIQMTSAEAREERARTQLRVRRRTEYEKLIEQQRVKGELNEEDIYVPTAAERKMTVNAKGQYVDHRSRHTRSSTYPMLKPLPALSARRASPPGHHGNTLPPPLVGCECSECNSKQSLGALTLGKKLCQHHLTNQLTKSGQQILLGDKVVVRGERLGYVGYIGKLDYDIFDQIYIGIKLDMPVGNSDGSLKGCRYFQCAASHAVFVKPGEVICVTGRKPLTGGTAIPRVREKVSMDVLKWPSHQAKQLEETARLLAQHSYSPTPSSTRSASTIGRAKAITKEELQAFQQKEPYDLADKNIMEMSARIMALARKQKSQKEPHVTTPTPQQGLSPQPLPPIPEASLAPPPPQTTPPARHTPRPATPLERTLLELLSDADLGATGFLKANELKAVLLKLGKLSAEGVTDLLTQVGVGSADDAVGLPYHQLLPHLLPPLEQC